MRVNFHRPIERKNQIHDGLKTKTGKYFVSFVCEVKDPKPEYRGGEIGIDVGLKKLAVTSDGESFEKPTISKSLKQAWRIGSAECRADSMGVRGMKRHNQSRQTAWKGRQPAWGRSTQIEQIFD